ncbi:MAG: C69 family dipeptidase [Bacteroidales bacterium]|nr:C69 family dipeptidase [Bacteroidales bacterium]
MRLLFFLCFGIIAGRNATTDGYVYLGHNEDVKGERMLNIYNYPEGKGSAAYLWFEFPGLTSSDSYANEYSVSLASNPCLSREDMAVGGLVYEILTSAIQKARSAREAVMIIGNMVEEHGYGESGRTYLVADQREGWVCSVVRGRHWVAQRVGDDQIATVPDYYTIGQVNLSDTLNFLGSKDLIKYARKRGWYRPRRDGAFDFSLAYSDPAALKETTGKERNAYARRFFFGDEAPGRDSFFAGKPQRKFHRRDLSSLLTQPPVRTENTALTTVFTMNPAFPPKQGTVIWVGLPNQDAASQAQWTVFTKAPEVCHRYSTAEEALEKHFSELDDFKTRWPGHFYWHYLDPSTNIDVTPHDFTVYVPRQSRVESERDINAVGDTFNDHFHVLEDQGRGMLHAFWTQGSHEAANDEHVVFSKSADGGLTWTEPVMIAGSATLADPRPVAAWQQPMISKSGRLYCLWNQETTVKKHLCGEMWGRYSDDGGETWSEPETVPFPIRFDVDPEDPAIPPVWCMWQRPLRLGEGGKYLAGCSRYDREGISRVEFWQYENIDDDPEIRDIRVSFFNTGKDSFDASRIENDHPYNPRDGLNIEEACVVGLPDGRLFAVMRSTIGHPVWSVSEDDGKTWSRPEILRERDGGPAILQSCSPCPIYDLKGPEARSGEYFLMTHDSFDFNGLTAYQLRGPIYRRDGIFVPGAHQPVWFGEGTLFSPRDTGNSFYTSYTALNGEGVLWFGDQKFYLFGKRMSSSEPR